MTGDATIAIFTAGHSLNLLDYATAVENAPPGWRHFNWEDIHRLPDAVLRHELAQIPAQEVKLAAEGDAIARERMLRALFWTLVYQLEAERWDELARAEPIHPGLLQALPRSVEISLDIGAGSGRLTEDLVRRSTRVVAIEPSLRLGSMLAGRLPVTGVIAGWAESLPLPSRCAQLTAACGAFGPDPKVLSELRRVTAAGGCIAMINPEDPEWFESHGWSRISLDPIPPAPHEHWIDEFFGPPDPPRELVMLTVD